MKRYLVPFEGSPLSRAALQYATVFSRAVPGTIDICYIADVRALSNPFFDLTVLALQGIGMLGDLIPREQAMLELQTRLIARGEQLLEEVKKTPGLDKDGKEPITYTTRVEVANPPAYLSEISGDYDMLFLGLWGEMHEFKAGLWGGTSEAVIRRGKSPVFLATAEYRPFDRIIVGFDNRPRSRQALAWAGTIGESVNLPMIIITAGPDEKWREKILAEARQIASSYTTPYTSMSSSEPPAKAILGASTQHPDALICLGAFGDKPIRELFLGSVAEEVLRKAKAPVLLLK
jgi:nucleotide-binding universal stress UspA family protein